MNSKLCTGRFLLLGAAIFVMASAGAGAKDPTAVESAVGSWVGFSQTSGMPNSFQPASFDVLTTQGPTRFTGALTVAMGDGSVRFLCDGSVSKADIVSFEGKSEAANVVGRGRVEVLGDGSVRLAALEYHLNGGTGGQSRGFALLLQRAGGIDWGDLRVPAVQGSWTGTWTSARDNNLRGTTSLMVESQKGSALGGTVTSARAAETGAPTAQFQGNSQGTITLPAVQRGTSHTLVISADSSHGIIAVLIGLLLPAVRSADAASTPRLEGSYMLFRGAAEAFEGAEKRGGDPFDSGRYSLVPAVQ